MKEFVLWAIIHMGVADVDPQIVVADLPYNINGQTHCGIWQTPEGERSMACRVTITPARWAETRHDKDERGRRNKYSRAETTVLHELCHVKVFADYFNSGASDEKIATFRPHGGKWRKCMNEHDILITNKRAW